MEVRLTLVVTVFKRGFTQDMEQRVSNNHRASDTLLTGNDLEGVESGSQSIPSPKTYGLECKFQGTRTARRGLCFGGRWI